MTVADLTLTAFDPMSATDEEFVDVNALTNRIRAEKLPDDPPVPLEVTRAEMSNLPPEVDARFFAARDASGALVGMATAVVPTGGDNDHLAQMEIQVLPERRREGIASALLAEVIEFAEAAARTTLIAAASESIPAGAAFLDAIGAQVGSSGVVNRVLLADIDLDLMAAWVAAGEATPDYTLEWIDGAVPEDMLDEMAGVFVLMNDQPFDDIDFHAEHITAERVRDGDAALAAQGMERWIAVARHTPSNALAGFTEVYYRPEMPESVHQGGTAVDPKHRGHKLGKWLKAAMAQRVLRERSEAKDIRTGNANSNDAMLAINRQMGFRPLRAQSLWQAEVATVRRYVDERAKSVDG